MRPLIKDPDALFSAEWLASRFDVRVVVVIRHPAGFASSIKRLGWSLFPSRWVEQEALLRDKLAPYADRLLDYNNRRDVDSIDQSILMWKAIHHVVNGYRQDHPHWHFVRYEDLAERPIQAFSSLYRGLGLSWNDGVERKVENLSGTRNPGEVRPSSYRSIRRHSASASRTWRARLSNEEVRRIREGSEEVARYFYEDREWVQ
jgi:hypothetical protein